MRKVLCTILLMMHLGTSSAKSPEPEWVRDAIRLAKKVVTDEGALTVLFNAIITNITYKSDQELYGVVDYWATPRETMSAGAGDCEDMTILMEYMAERAGVSHIRQVYGVILQPTKEVHMVLGYVPPDKNKILLFDPVYYKDRPTSLGERQGYIPYFSFSRQGTWEEVSSRRMVRKIVPYVEMFGRMVTE